MVSYSKYGLVFLTIFLLGGLFPSCKNCQIHPHKLYRPEYYRIRICWKSDSIAKISFKNTMGPGESYLVPDFPDTIRFSQASEKRFYSIEPEFDKGIRLKNRQRFTRLMELPMLDSALDAKTNPSYFLTWFVDYRNERLLDTLWFTSLDTYFMWNAYLDHEYRNKKRVARGKPPKMRPHLE